MKMIDILDKQMTVLSNVEGLTYRPGSVEYTQINLSLRDIIDLGYKYKQPIDKLREMEYHSTEQLNYKTQFPVWFVGGTFPMNKTHDCDIIEYSNLLAIDIDKKDNPNIDIKQLKSQLIELPYVVLVSKSISGEGIYAIVLVEDGKSTKEYYKYLDKLWSQKYNIVIDHQCTNIGRKRFISYDSDLLIKSDNIEITPWKLKQMNYITESPQQKRLIDYKPVNIKSDPILVTKAIWHLLNTGYSIDNINCTNQYSVWYHIGCEFRHFDDGEDMFVKFSTNSNHYSDDLNTILKKWNNTKIESSFEDVARKWCGLCKKKYGTRWIEVIK